MKFPNKPDPKLIRASIALVWLYQGLWCKLLGGVPRHAAVIAAVPSDILTSPEINIGRFCKSGANPYPEKLFPWR